LVVILKRLDGSAGVNRYQLGVVFLFYGPRYRIYGFAKPLAVLNVAFHRMEPDPLNKELDHSNQRRVRFATRHQSAYRNHLGASCHISDFSAGYFNIVAV
jgi:hypothetical protein